MNSKNKNTESSNPVAPPAPSHISTDSPFWMVANPTFEKHDLKDVFFKSSLCDLEARFRKGLTSALNPTIYTDRGEAEAEAKERLRRWEERQAKGFVGVSKPTWHDLNCNVYGCREAPHVTLRVGGAGRVHATSLCRHHGRDLAFDLARQFNELEDLLEQAKAIAD